MRIGIIGAGLSGAVIAHELTDESHSCVIFEKSRGCGGRLSNRRIDDDVFHHGAYHLDLCDEALTRGIESTGATFQRRNPVIRSGGVCYTADDPIKVIRPKMNELIRPLIENVECRFGKQVSELKRRKMSIEVVLDDGGIEIFDALFVTAPPVQSAQLLQEIDTNLSGRCARRRMGGQWVIMVRCYGPDVSGADIHLFNGEVIEKVVRQESLHSQNSINWVIYCKAELSETNIDLLPQQIEALVSVELLDAGFIVQGAVQYIRAHRWRYSYSMEAEPMSEIAGCDQMIYIAGDWSYGIGMQAAYASAMRAVAIFREHWGVDPSG
jgi:predicted NAD/FAD-dependent oxidoreductase